MTAEERKVSAAKAARAKAELSTLPTAEWGSADKPLVIGDTIIPCYVLSDGTRVLTQEGFLGAIGRAKKAKGGQGATTTDETAETRVPSFLAAANLRAFISDDLLEATNPVVFKTPSGVRAFGYRAELLPKVCRVYLEARDANALLPSQAHVARSADILMRGLAEVGIIALVDEATGYQRDRAKDALARILEAFVAKELQPWVRTFPADYYEQLFRLYSLPYPPEGNRNWRPQFFGRITNEVVYNRLAPDLLPSLKKAANKAERKAKLHQWLSQDIGHPKLREHLASIVTLQKLARSPQEFMDLVNRIHPRFGETLQLDFGEMGS